jgi:hypothetical protein
MLKQSLTGILVAVLTTVSAASATAATAPVSNPRIQVHFDLAAGQQPENIAFEPDGSVDLVLAGSYQLANVNRRGETRVLATLPTPADGGVNTPALGFALTTGLARAWDGTLYVGFAAGSDELTGIWKVSPGGVPHRIGVLPATSFPNGMALNQLTGDLFVSDSALGRIWRVPTRGGTPSVWLSDPALNRDGLLGANGLKLHKGAVWATNTDSGTLLRIPFTPRGTAGPVETKATGMPGIDDFDFLGTGDTVIAALNAPNEVVLIKPDGAHSPVLTAEDGLSGPTSLGIRGNTLYVGSASFLLRQDPNLLLADLSRHH